MEVGNISVLLPWIGVVIVSGLGMYFLSSELTKNIWVRLTVAILYATTPYLYYVGIAQGDWKRSAFYAVFSWVTWAMLRLKQVFNIKNVLVAGTIVGACFYTDAVVACVACCFGVLYLLLARRFKELSAVAMGIVIGSPRLLVLLKYLVTGESVAEEYSLASIMHSGYTIGRFFASYYFVEHLPGLGIAFIGVVALLLWRYVLKERFPGKAGYRSLLFCVLLAAVCSLERFPWDVVQRVHVVFLRFVPLMKELNIFVGLMNMGIAVLAVPVLEDIWTDEKDAIRYGTIGMLCITAVGGMMYYFV